MGNDKKIALFESVPIPKAVAKLCIPTILSSLVMVLYSLADTYYVGILNDPVQNSAVTLAGPVLLAFNAINNLFGVGSSSMMSRALGRKDYDTVKRSSSFGFYCSLFFGVLFALSCTIWKGPLLALLGTDAETTAATAAYMLWTVTCGAVPAILNVVMAYMVRSEGAALHASLGTMSGCILNMILDPIFILPGMLNMGAAGAGLATFLSNCFACCYFFFFIYRKRRDTFVCINPRMFCVKGEIVKGVFGVGVPASIQNLLNVTGMTILNNFVAVYGPDAVAAMGITHKINMIPMQVCMGLAQGIMPLVSYNYASGNHKRMKNAVLFTGTISISAIVLTAVIMFIKADAVVRLFMDNPAVIAYGEKFLRGLLLGLPFLCIDFLAIGVFQALGFGKYALLFAIMRKIVLEIPAIYILNALFPLYGLAYSQLVAEFVLAIAALIMLSRIMNPNKSKASAR